MMEFIRQEGIVKTEKVQSVPITVIGAGAVGSFVTLALTKLGVENLEVFDDDGVSEHNLPNQFYRVKDASASVFKVDALTYIVEEFNGVHIVPRPAKYVGGTLRECVIVTADNMVARKLAWENFKAQPNCKYFIDARMGGQLGIVYAIAKTVKDMDDIPYLSVEDCKFYEETLHSDEEAAELPCTARSIIYNVLMVASLVSRAFKAFVSEEKGYPREVIADFEHMIFMDRK